MADSKNVWAATIPTDNAAVFAAPLGTTLPTDATTDLDPAFIDLGWVSEDGVKNGIKRDTTKHYAWGGDVVKTTQDRYTETVQFALLETSADVLKVVYGEDNVTDTNGEITVNHSSQPLGRMSFVIDYIDGDNAGRLLIKEGQVTELADVAYSHKDLLMYDLTVDIYKPADGTDGVDQFLKIAGASGAPAVAPAPPPASPRPSGTGGSA